MPWAQGGSLQGGLGRTWPGRTPSWATGDIALASRWGRTVWCGLGERPCRGRSCLHTRLHEGSREEQDEVSHTHTHTHKVILSRGMCVFLSASIQEQVLQEILWEFGNKTNTDSKSCIRFHRKTHLEHLKILCVYGSYFLLPWFRDTVTLVTDFLPQSSWIYEFIKNGQNTALSKWKHIQSIHKNSASGFFSSGRLDFFRVEDFEVAGRRSRRSRKLLYAS